MSHISSIFCEIIHTHPVLILLLRNFSLHDADVWARTMSELTQLKVTVLSSFWINWNNSIRPKTTLPSSKVLSITLECGERDPWPFPSPLRHLVAVFEFYNLLTSVRVWAGRFYSEGRGASLVSLWSVGSHLHFDGKHRANRPLVFCNKDHTLVPIWVLYSWKGPCWGGGGVVKERSPQQQGQSGCLFQILD